VRSSKREAKKQKDREKDRKPGTRSRESERQRGGEYYDEELKYDHIEI
jgi:hypothetical protein